MNNKIIKILDSLLIGRNNITVLDIALLTNKEIDKINNKYYNYCRKRESINHYNSFPILSYDMRKKTINIFYEIFNCMNLDELVYVIMYDHKNNFPYYFYEEKMKIKDIKDELNDDDAKQIKEIYVKRLNKFQKWMMN